MDFKTPSQHAAVDDKIHIFKGFTFVLLTKEIKLL